jgi:multidrug efflux pump subunit AcrA (membrane-fusion protein)
MAVAMRKRASIATSSAQPNPPERRAPRRQPERTMTNGAFVPLHWGDIHTYNTRQQAFDMRVSSGFPPAAHRSASAGLAIALALAATLAVGACKRGGEGDAQAKEAAKGPEAVPVEVAQVSHRPIAASYSGTAPLEARGESQVVAKTSGVALSVMAEEGQQVHAGQVLVRLDSARAALQAAQSASQMRKLESNYARSRQLAEQKLISANDIDQIKYDLENARAVNRLANLELSYANVTAPISGVIAQRSIKPGNFVQINTPIFRIVDTSRLEAHLALPHCHQSLPGSSQEAESAQGGIRRDRNRGWAERPDG